MKKKKNKMVPTVKRSFKDEFRSQLPFWILIAIPMTSIIIFRYWSMFGIAIAFQDYKIGDPFVSVDSRWVGLKWFKRFIQDPYFGRYLLNTVRISFWSIVFGFPDSIVLALMFNEVRNMKYRNLVTNISILPHFVSTVVIVAMLTNMFNWKDGIVNLALNKLGIESIDFVNESKWFYPLYIGSGMWQGAGYGTIVYTAAIAGIDPTYYEAAKVDGASRWKCMYKITIPCILPTIVTLFILRVGSFLSVGYEKIILMYSPKIYDVADTLSTYNFRIGIEGGNRSLSAAISLMINVVEFGIIIVTNKISKKLSETALW